jgi:hypothetical protein
MGIIHSKKWKAIVCFHRKPDGDADYAFESQYSIVFYF